VGIIGPSFVIGLFAGAVVTTPAQLQWIGIGGVVGLAIGAVVQARVARYVTARPPLSASTAPHGPPVASTSLEGKPLPHAPLPPSAPWPTSWAQTPIPLGGRPSLVIWPKNPATHAIASMFLPGLGTLLAGRVRRGIALLCMVPAVWAVFFGALSQVPEAPCTTVTNGSDAIARCSAPSPTPVALDLVIPLVMLLWLVVWSFGVIDGYRSAQAWNRAHGIVS
jgi:hypothetical protein